MLQKLEKYADNLESIVEQRTAELVDEKQKTDMLLHRMLPPYASEPIVLLHAVWSAIGTILLSLRLSIRLSVTMKSEPSMRIAEPMLLQQ